MFSRILCRFLGHRRSGRSAHLVEGQWHSRCKRCGTKLVRIRHSEWRELPDELRAA
jgi:hypothetical protein